jgi:hypothetical protein
MSAINARSARNATVAATNAGATNKNAETVANVVVDTVNKAVQAANKKGNSPANAAKAAEPAAVNAARNAGASNAVAKAAASAAVSAARKPPPVLTNSAKKRLTRKRGAKLYAEIQAGTKTATPAQQACITKYEACKKPTQAGGRRYTRKSSKYHGGDKNQNMQLLKIKNSLLRVNKTAIRVKNHGNMSKPINMYNTTHHPWNNGFK